MSEKPRNRKSDLLGAGRLALDAVNGITGIVESMHQTITRLPGAAEADRKGGIAGLVYSNIRTVTDLLGSGIDSQLHRFEELLEEDDSTPRREAIIAALNGVLGDHLEARGNPLAIRMQLRRAGKPWKEAELLEAIDQAGGQVVLLVHGSSMNDLQWNRQEHDHGAALAADLGMLPLYLHYNTGRHVSVNGRQLADLLESLASRANRKLNLRIVVHSMGGLVSRSALHYGRLQGHGWVRQVSKIVFLGTPHHGAPLEKGGNWIDTLLEMNPYSAPFSRLGKIRSAGVTDLRYGYILDEHWEGRDRFEPTSDLRTPVPLPEDVQSYTVAATIKQDPGKLGDHLVGDGLVTLNSALGVHQDPQLSLQFPEDHQWVGRGMNHMEILNHPDVYSVIRGWLEA